MRFAKLLGLALVVGAASVHAVKAEEPLNWETPAQKAAVDRFVARADATVEKGPFQADWDSLKGYRVPDWYRDLKFGIFLHWGLYSVAAFNNEWYSRNMYQKDSDEYKHQTAVYGPLTKFGYKDFIPLFKAEKFDAKEWVSLFKEAGFKYMVPVAEHHDGFAMYDSTLTRWSVAKMGPKKDTLGLLAAEARRQGLVLGLSSHRAEHWWFMSGGRKFDSDVQDPKYADFYGPALDDDSAPDEAYLRNWLARSVELVEKYRPQIVYFDWWIGEKKEFDPYVRKFAAFFYDQAAARKEGVVLNTKDKAYVPGTSVMDLERGGVTYIRPEAWQTDTSLSWGSWCYIQNDKYKDAGLVVRTLIDTVSKNGNLLLNVGPKSDGTFPEEEVRVLKEVGAWLKVNGEAIYGTRPWTFYGEGPTQDKAGKFSESDTAYQDGDVRYTRKGNVLYVLSLVQPTRPLQLTLLGEKAAPALKVKNVTLLGRKDPVVWKRGSKDLTIQAPAKDGTLPVVFRVELSGASLGRLRLEASGWSVRASAEIQNYGEKPLNPQVALFMDGKKSAETRATVEADLSETVTLAAKTDRPGFYRMKLSADGWSPLESFVTLPVMDLSGEWFFHKGDEAGWKDPGLTETGWEKVVLPDTWEHHSGYTQDNVYGWYRKHVLIPEEWKGHDLSLPLGKIDDVDVSYFNGHEVGHMGTFPPDMKTAWNDERHYTVPAKDIHFGGDNVIAIRVFDGTGSGGLDAGPLGPLELVP